MATARANYYEVWSRTESGRAEKHGAALGVTFQDACKQLACDSLDFWQHFDKGMYRGQRLYPTEHEALADDS